MNREIPDAIRNLLPRNKKRCYQLRIKVIIPEQYIGEECFEEGLANFRELGAAHIVDVVPLPADHPEFIDL